ncbi:MAG: trypsin-like peptidase domain-containing protein [Mogibacterium sp.]|nr:trypsin-like peptidase domain-containing protein [Mogibacterium sp.]
MKKGGGAAHPWLHTGIMDEKDRHIITFGGDDDISLDVDIPQDIEPEVHPYDDSEYEDRRQEYYSQEAGADSVNDEEYAEPEETYDRQESYHETYTQPLNVKPVREKRYVTRGALVLCMILTMLLSSVLGAYFGATLGRAGNGNSDNSGSSSSESSSDLSQLSLSDATGSELTIADVVAMNEDSVVEILVSGTTRDFFGQMQVSEGAGSGVIINENGYIVTNYHVIQGANKVQVTLHNGETYPATIVGGVNENDIAVIKINATDLKVAKIGDSSTVKVGDTAVAIGNPLGQLGGTATTGIISALDRRLQIDGRTLDLLQTDAAINGGNSGGGLFNSRGELIGIVDAKSSGVGIEGLAFAIPINSVTDIINDLVENGKVSAKPAIGIMIQDVSEENAQYYNLEAAGVYVAQVTGENAQRAGFQQGDRIISINGDKIESSSDLISRVRACKVGDTVTVVISRSGQEIEIKTVLEESTATE